MEDYIIHTVGSEKAAYKPNFTNISNMKYGVVLHYTHSWLPEGCL